MKNIDVDDGYKALINAIISEAVDERVAAEIRIKDRRSTYAIPKPDREVVEDTDEFFKGEWFDAIAPVDKSVIYKAIAQRVKAGEYPDLKKTKHDFYWV